jgi:hypothetical protein
MMVNLPLCDVGDTACFETADAIAASVVDSLLDSHALDGVLSYRHAVAARCTRPC